jgi:hypothetical protein
VANASGNAMFTGTALPLRFVCSAMFQLIK